MFPKLNQFYFDIQQKSLLRSENQVWGQTLRVGDRLLKLQKTSVRLMTFSNHIVHLAPLFRQQQLNTISELVFIANIKLVHQALNNLLPAALSNVLRLQYVTNNILTRAQTDRLLERFEVRTSTFGIFSISYQCIINWNELQNFNSPAFLTNLSYSQLRKKTLEFLYLSIHIICLLYTSPSPRDRG